MEQEVPQIKISESNKSQNKGREGPKSERSPIKDFNSSDLHYVRPAKEASYELRPKLQHIFSEIDRQQVGGTLELIGMDIKDSIIGHICEYLRAKKLKYSMIKLVKNGISDEGLKILLSYLSIDDFTKMLNLTSNQLTNRSLKLIEEFVGCNHILKTIYVSNNKITPIQLKKLQPIFDSKFVQVILWPHFLSLIVYTAYSWYAFFGLSQVNNFRWPLIPA